MMWSFRSFCLCIFCIPIVNASVTVYSQAPLGQTSTAAAANYTGAAAYNPTVLNPPPAPSPPVTQFPVQLQSSSSAVVNLSIPQTGPFLGFSIEMSVINQVIGLNGSFIQVPFLNLMANIKERAGRVAIRVGGNTQETATVVDSLADGKAIEKDKAQSTNPTETPALLFTPEIIYMLANVSALVNVQWYLGIPFNDTSNLRLQIAEIGESILGSNLLGLQVANEPDLYADHGHRPAGYGPSDYFNEFGILVQAIANDANIPVRNNLIGPSIATGDWTPEMVWDTGFIPAYTSSLGALAVEHYPDDNCFAQFGIGTPKDPQEEFTNYLNHTAGQLLVAPYLNSTLIAQQNGKPFLMFETNTASCGGFAGISNSFGSALWALDYGLQMAYSNFSEALFHVGGQSVFYNPFTPPPTNQSTYHQWTIGPIYYSVLIAAEVFGSSNQSQIVDLNANGGNIFTPGYAVYENGQATRLALFNYVTDASGASTYTATVSIGGGDTGTPNAVPSQVLVKYLVAPSVSEQSNITWAGQTFGGIFSSDGRPMGDESTTTIACDTNANTCSIPVPAPGFALVFLTGGDPAVSATQTFATTALTKTRNTATIDASVLATSNGHSGDNLKLGSTSPGSSGAGSLHTSISKVVVLVAAAAVGGVFLLK